MKRRWKYAANLGIIGGIFWIVSDIYLNSKEGQMTFSQALEYGYEYHGWKMLILVGGLLLLFFGHVFFRIERIVWNWIKGTFGKD